MARAAQAERVAALRAGTDPAGRELTLAFVTLELRLSSLAQQALADNALASISVRRDYTVQAQELIARFRSDFRPRAREVLEAAYDEGARLAGARPMGLVRRNALSLL